MQLKLYHLNYFKRCHRLRDCNKLFQYGIMKHKEIHPN
jgi:hypothetical protein